MSKQLKKTLLYSLLLALALTLATSFIPNNTDFISGNLYLSAVYQHYGFPLAYIHIITDSENHIQLKSLILNYLIYYVISFIILFIVFLAIDFARSRKKIKP